MSLTSKQRMKIERQPMPQATPSVRATGFDEVNLGFTRHLAQIEAERCLQCKNPKCIEGCPIGINIPAFIKHVAEGNLPAAAQSLSCYNALPGITGRVCPQETQCEQYCVRGNGADCSVAIGALERFVADWSNENVQAPIHPQATPSQLRIAVVGSGPAGLTAAGELTKRGYDVTVVEALHAAGGVLRYGIPEFRLPKTIIDAEVGRLLAAGVKIVTNVIIGQTFTIDELMKQEKFSAVFIANGAGLPVFLNIPGENLKGVYSANEYLTRVNLMTAYRFPDFDTPVLQGEHVVVIGGGNTAIDAVRTALRLGAKEARLVYRRSRTEMPARREEVVHAEEEGVCFHFLCNPLRILGDDSRWVRGIECARMELGEPDPSGRRQPIEVPNSEFVISCDLVIEAVGTIANPLLAAAAPDLKLNSRGYIEVDSNGMTSKPGVFAGGDITRGAATVILAMADGKRAAKSIDEFLQSSK